jgi:hypothetical protein
MTSQVVLVRGARSAAGGGSGCCSGDVRPFDEGGTHLHQPRADEVGEVYRALRAALPDVDVEVVSPSNWLWLLPTLIAGGRRRGLRGSELRRSVRSGMAVSSIVVDGAVVSSGRLPDPDRAVAAVRAELGCR